MHNRKTKEYKAQFKSPNDVHHYWQNRVQTENEIRKRMIKTVGQDHHMTQSLSPEKTWNSNISITRSGKTAKIRERIFSAGLGALFTKRINLKEKDSSINTTPKTASPHRKVIITRWNNGEWIPNAYNQSNFADYADKFARNSYMKPNQLEKDAPNLDQIIDDIQSDSNLSFSRKLHLIQRALVRNKPTRFL